MIPSLSHLQTSSVTTAASVATIDARVLIPQERTAFRHRQVDGSAKNYEWIQDNDDPLKFIVKRKKGSFAPLRAFRTSLGIYADKWGPYLTVEPTELRVSVPEGANGSVLLVVEALGVLDDRVVLLFTLSVPNKSSSEDQIDDNTRVITAKLTLGENAQQGRGSDSLSINLTNEYAGIIRAAALYDKYLKGALSSRGFNTA